MAPRGGPGPRRRGQGLTEYIIVVGLIALVLVAAVRALGATLDGAYAGATARLEAEVAAPVRRSGRPARRSVGPSADPPALLGATGAAPEEAPPADEDPGAVAAPSPRR